MIDLEENHLLDKSKKNMNILFEKFEAESVSIDTLDAPYLRFQQFVEFLKVNLEKKGLRSGLFKTLKLTGFK